MAFPIISGFTKCGLLSDAEVLGMLAKLPEAHATHAGFLQLTYVDSVQYRNGGAKGSNHVFGVTLINEEQTKAVIRIFRQTPEGNNDLFELNTTIYHEVGHVVFMLVMSEEQRLEWRSIHATGNLMWNVAGADPVEHFAETYAQYVLHPDVTKRLKAEYDFLQKEVFHNL